MKPCFYVRLRPEIHVFKYVLYAETLFSCEFKTNFPCFMSIQDKETMFHAKYIQENRVSCLIWTNELCFTLCLYGLNPRIVL